MLWLSCSHSLPLGTTPLWWLLHHILSLIAYTFRETGNFLLLLGSLWWVQIVEYVLHCRSYSFVCTVHHLIIIIVQKYLKTLNLKMPARYILSTVWVRLSIYSQLSIIQSIIHYVGLCVFSLPTPLVKFKIIYILCLIIIIKSDVWTITHCLGLGRETMVCAVCISIFLWYIDTYLTCVETFWLVYLRLYMILIHCNLTGLMHQRSSSSIPGSCNWDIRDTILMRYNLS